MRTILTSAVFALVLLSTTAWQAKPQYSIRVVPIADTLVEGIENKLEILLDGKPADVSTIAVNAKHATLTHKENSVFVATCSRDSLSQTAEIMLVQRGDVLLHKKFIIADKSVLKQHSIKTTR